MKCTFLFLNVCRQKNTRRKITIVTKRFLRLEVESDGSMPFLDILIKNETNSSFNTSVFPKKTFPGFTLKQLCTPKKYTINFINSVIHGRY